MLKLSLKTSVKAVSLTFGRILGIQRVADHFQRLTSNKTEENEAGWHESFNIFSNLHYKQANDTFKKKTVGVY